jgi:dipeptidase D
MELKELEPSIVWTIFDKISKIPRQSKKEDKIRDWVKRWADTNSILWKEDETGNVLLIGNATEGFEYTPGVILQAHFDMVAQKIPESNHDFEKDPIPIQIIDEYVTSDGTTLGADNGIGLAIALATLIDDSFKHGPIEVLLTVDEETGLTGAFALKKGFFSHKFLLNLDSDDEGEITISAAGGGDTKFRLTITQEKKPNYLCYRLKIAGLHGGHSGVDIDKPRLNAIKLLGEALINIRGDSDLFVCNISGGNAHNAIPRDGIVEFLIPEVNRNESMNRFKEWKQVVNRYKVDEPNISVELIEILPKDGIIQTNHLLSLIIEIPHGPIVMSKEIPNLVETSNNLATINMKEDHIFINCSTRSSVMGSLDQVRNELKNLGEKYSTEVIQDSAYPGWQSSLNSPFLKLVQEKYSQEYENEVKLKAIHAGLECGLFAGLDPELQIVSIGSEIKDAHSPQERVYISSVSLIWRIVKSVLSSMDQLK